MPFSAAHFPSDSFFPPAPSLVFEGDSLTADNLNGRIPWPTQFRSLPGCLNRGFIRNVALSGETAQQIAAQGAQIPALSANQRGVFYLLAGHNDLVAGRTDVQILANLATAVLGAEAKGYDVVLIAIPKSTELTAGRETYRASVNAQLTGRVVQVDATFPDPSNATYFYDGTHMTTAGAGVLANLIEATHPLASILV